MPLLSFPGQCCRSSTTAMMATLSSMSSRRYPGADMPSSRHPRREQAEVELKRGKAKEDGGQDESEGAESEDEEEEEQEEDCFFESFDRVPSRVSVCLDLPSDSDDEDDDDVRISFSSAVGPPIDLRCVTFSREEFLAELREQEEAAAATGGGRGRGAGSRGGGGRGNSFDYDIWSMEEPMSIKDRRRRLLQGMGFTSRSDFAASLRIASTRRRAPVEEGSKTSAVPKAARPSMPPLPPLPPTASAPPSKPQEASEPLADSSAEEQPAEQPEEQPAPLIRRRSYSDLASRQAVEPALMRCASAPASLYNLRKREPLVVGGADDGGAVGAKGDVAVVGELAVAVVEASPTKDPEEKKEPVVEEVSKEGSKGRINDLHSGIQVTMEEFERFLGYSPIVKELMRRMKGGSGGGSGGGGGSSSNSSGGAGATGEQKSSSNKAITTIPKAPKPPVNKKKGSWFKNIKHVASSVGLINDKDKAEAGPKAAGKASGDSSSELMKVHPHGKSYKELSGLYMSQEIAAHQGAIWCIKFSYDGRYLASAGEDRIVQVWQVQEMPAQELPSLQPKSEGAAPDTPSAGGGGSGPPLPPKKPLKKSKSKKRSVPDYIVMPEAVFALSEKPFCSFEGHGEDVLDLCWSKSQHLLSSSMDKTVRLWHIETRSCVKLFVHNDYVTCIHFNPTDDRYFISGSLDSKVRIWNVPDRQVVDWTDLHEMVTAVSYTPDGQGAFVGSHKGNCRIYKISENKLTQESMIELKSKKKKSTAKKITGLQFSPDSPTEIMVTSADSRIRVFDELKMVRKYRGFRNISSQIAASYTSDGHYVVSASEDSHVYVWKRDAARNAAGKTKAQSTTRSHEQFFCKDVSVAIPWPSSGSNCAPQSLPPGAASGNLSQQEPPVAATDSNSSSSAPPGDEAVDDTGRDISQQGAGTDSFAAATSSMRSGEQSHSWGLVVVTAGLGGSIRVFQNFGMPVRLNKQAMF